MAGEGTVLAGGGTVLAGGGTVSAGGGGVLASARCGRDPPGARPGWRIRPTRGGITGRRVSQDRRPRFPLHSTVVEPPF